MLLDGDINPQALMIWGIAIASTFLIMIFGICRDIKSLRERRASLLFRVKSLLVGDILKHTQFPLKRYSQLTTDLDIEKHIKRCENCAKPEECKRMLSGKEKDSHNFCPNYTELKMLKGKLIKH